MTTIAGLGGMFADEFIPGFDGWYRDALAVGCKIINSTDGTALREFPLVPLNSVLRGIPYDDYLSLYAEERPRPI